MKNGFNPQIVAKVFKMNGLPKPTFEYRFHPVRKWRMDIAWPEYKVACEVQGGIFTNGRHVRGASLLREWEKLNTGASMGWRFLYCQPCDVMKTETILAIKEALEFTEPSSE